MDHAPTSSLANENVRRDEMGGLIVASFVAVDDSGRSEELGPWPVAAEREAGSTAQHFSPASEHRFPTDEQRRARVQARHWGVGSPDLAHGRIVTCVERAIKGCIGGEYGALFVVVVRHCRSWRISRTSRPPRSLR